MVAKKYNVFHLVGAFNYFDIQIDRDMSMKEVRGQINDAKDEIIYWDDWTLSQKKKAKKELGDGE